MCRKQLSVCWTRDRVRCACVGYRGTHDVSTSASESVPARPIARAIRVRCACVVQRVWVSGTAQGVSETGAYVLDTIEGVSDRTGDPRPLRLCRTERVCVGHGLECVGHG